MRHYPLLILFATLGSFIFYWIFNGFMWQADGSISTFLWTLNADWRMHLSHVQAFAVLPFFEVVTNHPIYPGEVLSYPFFVNWISGMLFGITGNIVFSMNAVMYMGTVLFLVGIYFLTYLLTRNTWASCIAPILFFFLAGVQAYYLFVTKNLSFAEFSALHDYAIDVETLVPAGFNWKSFFLTTYLPQRSFLWGMAAGSILLGIFIWRFLQAMLSCSAADSSSNTAENKGRQKRNQYRLFLLEFFIIGLGIGSLSVIHTHTFFFFFFLFFGLMLLYWRYLSFFIVLAFGALITSAPFLFLLSQKTGGVSQFSLFPLHTTGYSSLFNTLSFLPDFWQNIIHIPVYWLYNWGLFFILVLCVLFCAKPLQCFFTKNSVNSNAETEGYSSTMLHNILWISGLLFLLFSIVQLQDNPWDNTKVHLWSALFFCIGVSQLLVHVWRYSTVGKIFASCCFLLCTASGVVIAVSGLDDKKLTMFSAVEMENAETIKNTIEPSSTVLTSDNAFLFFPSVVPNPVFMGYRGWIESYGLDSKVRTSIAQQVYRGSPQALSLLAQNNIEYVFVDPSVEKEYGVAVNHDFFHRYFVQVLSFENGSVLYKPIKRIDEE